MGVVDDDGEGGGDGDHLHPAFHAANMVQGVCALLQGNAQRQGGAQNTQGIIYHEAAGNMHPDGHALLLCHGAEGNTVRLQLDVLCP